ncbi:glycosyltransferase [Bacteroides fragilis]|nr:glycosyltransferase [Bacteroides fragilis]
MIKLSIITVTYNSEKYIEQTILSVINQHYSNIEYILIDGGSKDNTIKIIDKYKKFISYFISEPDRNMYDAINKGMRLATGDYIAVFKFR